MASYNDLSFDWNILFQNQPWTSSDLQLAAELGKTLLERNKELETSLKQHQNVIDDQAQEIEYLQKQTAALREVNDSRLRIYEQLEVGIQDLERANHSLIVENTADKKHIKSLLHNVETLENRCEELNKTLEDTRKSLTVEKRKNERLLEEKKIQNEQHITLRNVNSRTSDENNSIIEGYKLDHNDSEDYSLAFQNSFKAQRQISQTGDGSFRNTDSCGIAEIRNEEDEELERLMSELDFTKKSLSSEQQKVAELEEQLVAIIHENQSLQGRLAQVSTNEDMKSVHEELSILDEVRQGPMCNRCLRSIDERSTAIDEASSIAPTEDDDDRSLLDLMDNASDSPQIYRSSVTLKMSKPNSLDLNAPPSPNPYRELVEKYEALLEVQRNSIARKQQQQQQEQPRQNSCIEGNYINKDEDDKNRTLTENDNLNVEKDESLRIKIRDDQVEHHQTQSRNSNNSSSTINKNCRRTPTEFSETETSSSGFSDETSNKATQTDDRPGYFLCSIGDGEDCKFSIYDDASPIDSRFRNRPEYRELFKEIFAVLRKAAENKEEGDKLPLLDDTHPINGNKVPPVTPANEELPDFGECGGDISLADDTQSIISSVVSEHSVAMSECITKTERKTAKKHIQVQESATKQGMGIGASGIGNNPKQDGKIVENGRVLTPLKREPLEYLSIGVGIKKKNRRKNRNLLLDRSDSPVLPSPPRIYYGSGKKRRDYRPFPIAENSTTGESGNDSSFDMNSPRANRRNRQINQRLPQTPQQNVNPNWNGSSMVIYNRNVQSTTPGSVQNEGKANNGHHHHHPLEVCGMQFRPSTVSQDLHKLKKLDLSYAEVLRRADACKHHHRRK